MFVTAGKGGEPLSTSLTQRDMPQFKGLANQR